MFRNDDATSVASLPAPAAAVNPGFFTDGNPAGGQPATIVQADWLNGVTEELLSILTAAAILPLKTNNGQVLAALQLLFASNFRSFTASGSFVVPAGITRVKVRLWAGGGSGGGVTNTSSSGGGAGSGGYSEGVVTVVPGSLIPVTIGQGGPSLTAGATGATGGTTSFGSLMSATGGQPGGGSTSGFSAVAGAGGTGIGGGLNITGNSGGFGYSVGASSYAGGTGGAGVFGSIPSPNVGATGQMGVFPGGGGNGASASGGGGAGAPGLVLVEYGA